MKTITFKITDDEARVIALRAKEGGLTVSDYLRRLPRALGPRVGDRNGFYRSHDLCAPTGAAASDHGIGSGNVGRIPVKYLLDLNVLVAWEWADHVAHA